VSATGVDGRPVKEGGFSASLDELDEFEDVAALQSSLFERGAAHDLAVALDRHGPRIFGDGAQQFGDRAGFGNGRRLPVQPDFDRCLGFRFRGIRFRCGHGRILSARTDPAGITGRHVHLGSIPTPVQVDVVLSGGVPMHPARRRLREAWITIHAGVALGLLAIAPSPAAGDGPERAAIRAETNDTSLVTFGAQGIAVSSTSGSAGVVGAARAVTGDVRGILGKVASPQGSAAVFESLAGGSILAGFGPLGVVFEVAADGTVTVGDLIGDGSALGALGDLDCAGCLAGDSVLAAGSVDSSELAPGSVGEAELQSNSVVTAKIFDDAVDASALANAAVGTSELDDGAVESDDLAAASVTSSDIAAGAVTQEKIAADSLRRSDIHGTEVAIYQLHDDCYDPHLELTFTTTCQSQSCGVAIYLDCSGGCTAGAPQLCTNPIYGYLIDPDIND
jgi:hypothetical protein